jgi:alcohol dehydrogenase YqhD (iron-dependent ADH family)
MSDSSVITKEEGLVKRGYSSDYCRPKFAILNPELTMTLPDYQTACGCTDIMMHTMERYFTNGGNMEITDSMAEGLLRTVMANAKILANNPKDYDARAEVMWAGSLAHNGLTGCGNDGGDWMTHKLEHELGGLYDVAHGAGLAAIWGSWARYVYKECLPRFKRYAINVMGVKDEGTDEEIALKGIEAMEDFYREIKMPTNLRELGVKATEEDLITMAHKCAVGVGGAMGSAKLLNENDMLAIYKASM